MQKLLGVLSRRGPSKAGDLARALGLSQPSISRLLQRAGRRIVRLGRGRNRLYALPRLVGGLPSSVSLRRVDRAGRIDTLGRLVPVQPQGTCFESRHRSFPSGFSPRLPFFLRDMRPRGFLGGLVAREQRPEHWSEDQVLEFLASQGWNMPGHLVVGHGAIEQLLVQLDRPESGLWRKERAQIYPRRADDVRSHGLPGALLGGQQPKFLARLLPDGREVLVKFSPAGDGGVARRRQDLLRAEHLALEILRERGHSAAEGEIIEIGGRVFLEIRRFDREPGGGRRGVLSLESLTEMPVPWIGAVEALVEEGRLAPGLLDKVRFRACFARLIGEEDLHGRKLSFFVSGLRPKSLTPAYGLRPSVFAPRAEQLFDAPFQPAPPSAAELPVFAAAFAAAEKFWERLARLEGLSDDFRALAEDARGKVAAFERIAAHL